MMNFITATKDQGELREFNFQLNKLEDGFDILSRLVAAGETLLEVSLLEENRITPLPVQAFDGASLGDVIGQLEIEWEAILQGSLPESAPVLDRVHLLQRRLALCEGSIVRLELVMAKVEGLLQQARNMNAVRSKLIQHYQFALDHYSRELNRTYTLRGRLSQRLEEILISR